LRKLGTFFLCVPSSNLKSYIQQFSLSLSVFLFLFLIPSPTKEKKRREEGSVQHIGGRDSSVLLTRSLEIQTNQRAANNLPLASPPALLFSFLFAAFSTLCRVLKKKNTQNLFSLFIQRRVDCIYSYNDSLVIYIHILRHSVM
jgi:hypothetical protein